QMLRRLAYYGPSNTVLYACIFVLAVALAIALIPTPYEPPQIPSHQQSKEGVETDQQTKGGKITIKAGGENNLSHGRDEASEYWVVPFVGRKLKITDTLLVIFAFTLWWATVSLVFGSKEASEREARAYLGFFSARLGPVPNSTTNEHWVIAEYKNGGKTPA